jgi:selenocysteine lyase/cysteine desulfurase
MYTTGTYEGDVKTQARFNAEWTGEKPIKLCHRGIGGVIGLRVCCHMFNTRADVDYLIEAQKKILKN